MKPAESYDSFPEIKERLDQIVAQVSNDDLPLDQALSLYEEAVKLGARVSVLIESAQGEEQEEASVEEQGEQPAPSQECQE